MKNPVFLLFLIVAFCTSALPQTNAVDPERIKPLLPQISIQGHVRQTPKGESTQGLASYAEVIWQRPGPITDSTPVEMQLLASIRDTGYFANSYIGKYSGQEETTSSGNRIRPVTIKGKYPGKEQTFSNPTGCEVFFLVAGRFELHVTARSRGEVDMLVNAFDFQRLENFATKK